MVDSISPVLKTRKVRLREANDLLEVMQLRSAEPESMPPRFRINFPTETVVKMAVRGRCAIKLLEDQIVHSPQKKKRKTEEYKNPLGELRSETRALVLSHRNSTHTSLSEKKVQGDLLAHVGGNSWT